MPRLATLLLVVAVAACGGSSSSSGPSNTTPEGGGGSGGGAKLPWEAALTQGATFTLVDAMMAGAPEEEAGEEITVKVTSVEETGGERVYTLDWGEGANGPTKLRVAGGKVLINDAKPEDMQEPFDAPIGTCYGEDYSNPDGCEDVCDAQICLNDAGIHSISGLYAPGYGEYTVK